MSVVATYSSTLIAISLLIACVASFTALDLAARTRVTTGWPQRLWLVTAAVAMGGGIWAMHFVAMLAVSMPGMAISYDIWITLLSLLVAIVATGAGFALVSRAQPRRPVLFGAGVLMGVGVCAMHYLGMAGMRMPAALRYDPTWLAISALIAIAAATAALWLAGRSTSLGERVGAAIVMGAAISGMHFAGMRAATFVMASGPMDMSAASGVGQLALGSAVAVAAFLILFLALLAAMYDRRFALLAWREAEALRLNEERFRALYKGTPLPLHSLDADGRIEHVSNIWLEMMGYERPDVIGRPLINFLTEASARQLRQQDWPQLMTEGYLKPSDYKVVTRDGRFLDVVCAARVLRDEGGAFLHVLGGLTDVTERKRAEEALRQSQKIEAIGHLTGGIAHDFNNLLAVVIGNLDLLRRRTAGDDRALRLIDNAMKGADRGAALTQRLLAFARRQDLRLEPVDVRQLVLGMSDMLQRSLGPMVRVETRFPLDLPTARADAHQLELALLNLGVNARDAMPEGGELLIYAEQVTVPPGKEEGLEPGSYLRLTLTDSGVGMDADTLARAVEPFYTTKAKGQGTGLGLSMVQGLVAQTGGRLTLRSQVGVGTTVEVLLPVAELQTESAFAERSASIASPVQRRHILVVDDDPLVLSNTAAMLEDLGHAIVTAETGHEALRILSEDRSIDLVISDQLMPGMTGTQLFDRMETVAPGTPMLLVTGFSDLGGSAMPSIPVLRKPFTQARLAEQVAAMPFSATVVSIRSARR